MGTWGAGPFDNDDALDFVAEFEETNTVAMVEATLRAIADSKAGEYVEAPECSRAVAASALIVLADGPQTDVVGEAALETLRALPAPEKRRLSTVAIAALDRIASNSELKDLWDESGDESSREAWRSSLTAIRSKLTVS